jgi:acyl-CoA thioester hydrolase
VSAPARFYSRIKVRYNETDMQGHVNFGQYLFYFDVGATEYLEAIGFGYDRLLSEGIDLLYAESHCNYYSRVRWPEVLRVHTRISQVGRRSLRYDFEVVSETDGRRVATGHIVAVAAERSTWKEKELPAGLRTAIASHEEATAPEAA